MICAGGMIAVMYDDVSMWCVVEQGDDDGMVSVASVASRMSTSSFVVASRRVPTRVSAFFLCSSAFQSLDCHVVVPFLRVAVLSLIPMALALLFSSLQENI